MALTPDQEREIKRLQDQYVRAKAEGNMALANASHADANGIRYSAGVSDQYDSTSGARVSSDSGSSRKSSLDDFTEAYAKQMANRDTKLRSRRDGVDLTPEIEQNYRDDSGRDRVRLLPKMNFLLGQEQQGIQNMMADRNFQAQQAQQDYTNILAEREFAVEQAAREWQQRQAEKAANWNAAMQVSERYGTTVDPKQNWQYLLEQVRGLKPVDVMRDERDYNRGVFESDRDYNRGVFESNRDYNRPKSSGGGGSSSGVQKYLMDIWKLTGEAPVGLPGVEPGTPLYSKDNSTAGDDDAKTWETAISLAQKDASRNEGAMTYEQMMELAQSYYERLTGGKPPSKTPSAAPNKPQSVSDDDLREFVQ
ncbi:hypothetical protein [Brevibacillus centrosporus]|uniref:hypothetical protein n=1 Tax=Brevibacillus centrosporus TaxID=54910 RepID=UPI002E242761|nr:hypothetical protein [Brevibacillus centrosporus]